MGTGAPRPLADVVGFRIVDHVKPTAAYEFLNVRGGRETGQFTEESLWVGRMHYDFISDYLKPIDLIIIKESHGHTIKCRADEWHALIDAVLSQFFATFGLRTRHQAPSSLWSIVKGTTASFFWRHQTSTITCASCVSEPASTSLRLTDITGNGAQTSPSGPDSF